MARILETVYTVYRRQWLSVDNTPREYWEVLAGYNPRDFAAVNFNWQQTLIGKYKSEVEALDIVERLKRGERV